MMHRISFLLYLFAGLLCAGEKSPLPQTNNPAVEYCNIEKINNDIAAFIGENKEMTTLDFFYHTERLLYYKSLQWRSLINSLELEINQKIVRAEDLERLKEIIAELRYRFILTATKTNYFDVASSSNSFHFWHLKFWSTITITATTIASSGMAGQLLLGHVGMRSFDPLLLMLSASIGLCNGLFIFKFFESQASFVYSLCMSNLNLLTQSIDARINAEKSASNKKKSLL